MSVERAKVGDTQAVIDVFRQARAIALPYRTTLHTNEEDLAYFGSAIEKSIVYVAREDDRIVGFR